MLCTIAVTMATNVETHLSSVILTENYDHLEFPPEVINNPNVM